MTTISARDLNRDVSAAKRAADEGPVVITDRGEPAYVLLSVAEYRRLTRAGAGEFLLRLRMPDEELANLEFEPVRLAARVPEL